MRKLNATPEPKGKGYGMGSWLSNESQGSTGDRDTETRRRGDMLAAGAFFAVAPNSLGKKSPCHRVSVSPRRSLPRPSPPASAFPPML